MKRELFFIYDDTQFIPSSIESVVGKRSYGEIIYKKQKIKEVIRKVILSKGIQFLDVTDQLQLIDLPYLFTENDDNYIYIHYHSNAVIIDEDKFSIILDKLCYIEQTGINQESNPYMLVFNDLEKYRLYLGKLDKGGVISKEDLGSDCTVFSPSNFAMSISEISSFLKFFSGGFEARYFNHLSGDDYIIIKKSNDKLKLKKEHQYFHLLPDSMKKWMVLPYDFKETENFAEYTMERLNIPDMALQWIHNAVSLNDLNVFLDKLLNFVVSRPTRPMSQEDFKGRFKELYFNKVLERLDQLKEHSLYSKIQSYLVNGTNFNIDEIMIRYEKLFYKIENKLLSCQETIGHGDLCFSNILYDKSSYLMKFIDPKGALKEGDLWTDPYYDLAKLSHSILGSYDFINNELFSISLNNDLQLKLGINSIDLSALQDLFIRKMAEQGYDLTIVRLCEASLFLSMLPLHIDNPRKVIAFILNAIKIIEELEKNVK